MGKFFEQFTEISGSYLKGTEKEVLAENGIPFEAVAVQRDDDNQYGPRYVVTVLVPDPETGDAEQKLLACPIGTVESRDRMLRAMSEYLASEDAEPVILKLEKVGRSWILRDAE